MVSYDLSIIQQHADRLYSRADAILAVYGLGFTAAGIVVGFLLTDVLDSPGVVILVLSGLVSATLGIALGRARGFELRLQAQVALCQVQIELNTRQYRAGVQHPEASTPQTSHVSANH